MTPFSPGSDIPAAPIEIPIPDIPSANFQSIGMDLEKGRQAAAAAVKAAPGWLDWIADLVAKIVGALLGLVLAIVGYFLGLIGKVWLNADGGTDALAANAVSALFKVPVQANAFRAVTDPSQREAVAGATAEAIMSAIGVATPTGASGSIQPSQEPAKKIITTAMHLSIESWLQAFTAEALSLGIIKDMGELGDNAIHSLGMGRITHTMLGPAIKILATEPYLWFLNDKFRPKLPAESVAVRQYLRGLLPRADLDKMLGWQGYTADEIAAVINFNRVHLSASELESLVLHGTISDDDAHAALKNQGYDDNTAASALFVLRAARVDSWNLQIVNEAVTAFANHKMEELDLRHYIDVSGLPSTEKDLISILANLKRVNSVHLFTVSEGQQLVEKGLWNLDQFRALLFQHGYSPSDETDAELLLLGKIHDTAAAATAKAALVKAKADAATAKAKALAAKAANAALEAEAHGVSIAKYETLVLDGLKTIANYKSFLTGKGIAADNISALATVLQDKLTKASSATSTKAAAAAAVKPHNLNLAQLDAAVKAGLISTAEYEARLKSSGVSDADAALLVELLQDQINTAAAKAKAVADAKAQAQVHHVNLAEEETGVRLGLATVQQYAAFLKAAGFAPEDVTLLVSEMNSRLATDKTARASKAAIAAGLATKGVNLATLERAVRAGLQTTADYRDALAKAGYDSAAQDTLLGLLDLQMQQDTATFAAKGTASGLLDQRGVSLANLERAVKLGVVPIATYTDALATAGINADDANLLTLTLAASIKGTKAAQNTSAAVTKQLKAVGLNLATLEKDVLSGKLTVSQFVAQLAGAGVSAADQSALGQLMQDQVDNQAAAQAQVNQAAQRAAVKGLNLGQETAAVKAGVKTIEEFQIFVASLGYDAADVDTITATLSAQLGAAAAAKASKKQPTVTDTTPSAA